MGIDVFRVGYIEEELNDEYRGMRVNFKRKFTGVAKSEDGTGFYLINGHPIFSNDKEFIGLLTSDRKGQFVVNKDNVYDGLCEPTGDVVFVPFKPEGYKNGVIDINEEALKQDELQYTAWSDFDGVYKNYHRIFTAITDKDSYDGVTQYRVYGFAAFSTDDIFMWLIDVTGEIHYVDVDTLEYADDCPSGLQPYTAPDYTKVQELKELDRLLIKYKGVFGDGSHTVEEFRNMLGKEIDIEI